MSRGRTFPVVQVMTGTVVYVLVLYLGKCTARNFVLTEIDAAGRSAELGDVYDKIHDRFTASSYFKEKLPDQAIWSIPSPSPPETVFKVVHDYSERSSILGVSTSLHASAYLGLLELSGSARAATSFKLRRGRINGILKYSFTKGTQRLNLRHRNLARLRAENASEIVGGSHVLVEIDYGASVVACFRMEFSETEKRAEVESYFSGAMDSLAKSLQTENQWNAETSNYLNKSAFEIEIYGDTFSDELPATNDIENVYKVLKEIPKNLNKRTGKASNGKAIRYRLYATSMVSQFFGPIQSSNPSESDTNEMEKCVRFLENQVVSLYYHHEKNLQTAAEEEARIVRHANVLPEVYLPSIGKAFRNYTSHFKASHDNLRREIVAARESCSVRNNETVLNNITLMQQFADDFEGFLNAVEKNVTEKVVDAKILKAHGFRHIPHAMTAEEVAVAHSEEIMYILYLRQSWRDKLQSLHLDCIATGRKIPHLKFVADCDFSRRSILCSTLTEPTIMQYSNGVPRSGNLCQTRSSSTPQETTFLQRVLSFFASLVPENPFG